MQNNARLNYTNIGAAILVDDPTAHTQPTVAELLKWSVEQQESIRSQIALSESKARAAAETHGSGSGSGSASTPGQGRAMSEEAVRKRKDREERKRLKEEEARKRAAALEAEDGDGDAEGDEEGDGETSSVLISSTSTVTPTKVAKRRQQPKLESSSIPTSTPEVGTTPDPEPISKPSSSSTTPYTIVIPASSTSLPWYNPPLQKPTIYTTISSARTAGIWSYPSTLSERARCGVFKSLHAQGYFMGVGIRFGGEYLVYPGDPLRYHSHFAATVIESPVASLRPMEIVAHGRLGTATKKAHLLCGWDDERGMVDYLSIEWAGFG